MAGGDLVVERPGDAAGTRDGDSVRWIYGDVWLIELVVWEAREMCRGFGWPAVPENASRGDGGGLVVVSAAVVCVVLGFSFLG